MLELLLKALATWRISHMLVHERGPYDVFMTMRFRLGLMETVDGPVTNHPTWVPLYCVWCTSMWVGLIVARLPLAATIGFALSAVAIWLEETYQWTEEVRERGKSNNTNYTTPG